MTADPACCISETALQEVAQMMIDHDCGEIPVVDGKETKRPIGVILPYLEMFLPPSSN